MLCSKCRYLSSNGHEYVCHKSEYPFDKKSFSGCSFDNLYFEKHIQANLYVSLTLVLQQYIEISDIYPQTLRSPIINMKFLDIDFRYDVFNPRV